MSKVTLKVEDPVKFKPITVTLEIVFESEDEVADWKLECTEGTLESINTDYSTTVYEVLQELTNLDL